MFSANSVHAMLVATIVYVFDFCDGDYRKMSDSNVDNSESESTSIKANKRKVLQKYRAEYAIKYPVIARCSTDNLPLACADHKGPLFRKMFPDSTIATKYGCARTKTGCVLETLDADDVIYTKISLRVYY